MSSNVATNVTSSAGAWLFAMPRASLVVIALVLVGTGAFLLWRTWRNIAASALQTAGCWLVISFSVPFWIAAYGPEFGLSFFAIAISLFVWLLIVKNIEDKPLKTLPLPKNARSSSNDKLQITTQVVNVLLLCPLVSLALMMSAELLSPFELASTMVIEVLVFPIIWACVAIWVVASEKLYWLTLAFAVISALLLWLLLS